MPKDDTIREMMFLAIVARVKEDAERIEEENGVLRFTIALTDEEARFIPLSHGKILGDYQWSFISRLPNEEREIRILEVRSVSKSQDS